jgi:hypothetical protein
MLRQVRGVRKRLWTLFAFVRLGLAHVRLRMPLQLGLGPEHLQNTTAKPLVCYYSTTNYD